MQIHEIFHEGILKGVATPPPAAAAPTKAQRDQAYAELVKQNIPGANQRLWGSGSDNYIANKLLDKVGVPQGSPYRYIEAPPATVARAKTTAPATAATTDQVVKPSNELMKKATASLQGGPALSAQELKQVNDYRVSQGAKPIPAPTPLQVGPGVQPQMTVAPTNVSFNTNLATSSSAKKRTGGRVAGEPLSQTPNAIRKRNARLAKKNTTAADAGANVMGSMVQQLAPRRTTSSTGGTITQTPTGLVHTAKPASTKPVATAAKKKTTTKKTPAPNPTWKGRGKNLTKQQQDYISEINASQPQSVAENKFSKLEEMLTQALHAHGYPK